MKLDQFTNSGSHISSTENVSIWKRRTAIDRLSIIKEAGFILDK